MKVTVACDVCRHRSRVPEERLGEARNCGICSARFFLEEAPESDDLPEDYGQPSQFRQALKYIGHGVTAILVFCILIAMATLVGVDPRGSNRSVTSTSSSRSAPPPNRQQQIPINLSQPQYTIPKELQSQVTASPFADEFPNPPSSPMANNVVAPIGSQTLPVADSPFVDIGTVFADDGSLQPLPEVPNDPVVSQPPVIQTPTTNPPVQEPKALEPVDFAKAMRSQEFKNMSSSEKHDFLRELHEKQRAYNEDRFRRLREERSTSNSNRASKNKYDGPGSVPPTGKTVRSASELKVGQIVLVRDGAGWYPSDVEAIRGNQVRIHFRGWSRSWDKEVPVSKIQIISDELLQ